MVTATPVAADKISTLLDKYDVEIYEDKDNKKEELTEAQKEYEDIAKELEYLKRFNDKIETIDMESIQNTVAVIAQELLYTQSQLLEGIDLTYEEIFNLEQRVYELRTAYSICTTDAIYYATLYKYTLPINEVEEALSKVEQKADEYSNAVQYGDIGDVTTVAIPLIGKYYVSSAFGGRIDPLDNISYDNHRGTDFAANEGTPVLALFSGTVITAEWHYGMGNFIRIDHGHGVVSSYLHLSKISVNVGDMVEQYDKIGEVGGTGQWATGPHLHLSMTIEGTYVDPYKLWE